MSFSKPTSAVVYEGFSQRSKMIHNKIISVILPLKRNCFLSAINLKTLNYYVVRNDFI